MAVLLEQFRVVLLTPCNYFKQFMSHAYMGNDLDVKYREYGSAVDEIECMLQDYRDWMNGRDDHPHDYLDAHELEFKIEKIYLLNPNY